MTAPSGSPDKGRERASEAYEHVACPFCGIMCDDLQIARTGANLKVRNTVARRRSPVSSALSRHPARRSTARPSRSKRRCAPPPNSCARARLPMFGGLATDVEGMRAVMALAERSGGIVDHAFSEAQYRNFKVLQIERLDHVDPHRGAQPRRPLHHRRQRHPQAASALLRAHRLAARTRCSTVAAPKRTVVFIGKGLDRSGAKGPRIGEVDHARLARTSSRRGGRRAQRALARLSHQRRQARRRRARRDRCARRALPQRANTAWWCGRRRALDFPMPSSPSTSSPGSSRTSIRRIRFAGLVARRRRRRDDGGRRLHLAQRLSAAR